MLQWPIDPFYFYRDCLTVFVAVYYIAAMYANVQLVAQTLRGDDPQRRLLRLYLSYQLVTIRVRPLAGELIQLVIWLLILVGVWQLHRLAV